MNEYYLQLACWIIITVGLPLNVAVLTLCFALHKKVKQGDIEIRQVTKGANND